jgi:DNA-binding CsgD family transcriptional regulator
VIHAQLGAALLDYWSLSPLEVEALAFASQGKKTEAEDAEQEKINQQRLAAALRAAFPAKPKP